MNHSQRILIASVARHAGLSRQGMNKLLKRHGIDAGDFRYRPRRNGRR